MISLVKLEEKKMFMLFVCFPFRFIQFCELKAHGKVVDFFTDWNIYIWYFNGDVMVQKVPYVSARRSQLVMKDPVNKASSLLFFE